MLHDKEVRVVRSYICDECGDDTCHVIWRSLGTSFWLHICPNCRNCRRTTGEEDWLGEWQEAARVAEAALHPERTLVRVLANGGAR